MSILLFVLSILAAVAIFGGGLFYLIVTLLTRVSGWKSLAEHFTCDGPPPPNVLKRQTMQVGATRFRNSMSLGITAQGLYMHTRFTRPDLFIPWAAFRSVRPTTIYWRNAYFLGIGQPEIGKIGIFEDQYAWMQPFLGKPGE